MYIIEFNCLKFLNVILIKAIASFISIVINKTGNGIQERLEQVHGRRRCPYQFLR